MELHKLWILNWEPGSRNHTATITGASMRRCAREVGSTITSSSNDSLVGLHPVNSSIGHVVGHDSSAFHAVHDEIERKILNEENAIVSEGAAKQSVKHAMTCSVSNRTTSVGLTTLTEILGLATESSLIDLSLLSS